VRIVADRMVVGAVEAFAQFGEVEVRAAVDIDQACLRDADALFCRSTLKVNRALLDGSRVRFVGTATIGTDHLDVAWLDEHKIAWASAPGCNADSVEQWMAAALLALADGTGRALDKLRVGIVGVGNVGSRVERLVRAAGLPPPLRCDPPRARADGGDFRTLDDLLPDADVLTLHVPLTRTGPDATLNLMTPDRLGRMPRDAWLINACRGEVVDEAALEARLASGQLVAALDVFPHEPTPSPSLVKLASIATPHIAGHSLEGKYNGTRMVYEAFCRHLGIAPSWTPSLPPASALAIDSRDKSDATVVLEAVAAEYSIDADDTALRRILARPVEERAAAFRRLRDNYPERRELGIRLVTFSPPRERPLLAALGRRN
jgi:erythronate-4-phosphate dehydrogenase